MVRRGLDTTEVPLATLVLASLHHWVTGSSAAMAAAFPEARVACRNVLEKCSREKCLSVGVLCKASPAMLGGRSNTRRARSLFVSASPAPWGPCRKTAGAALCPSGPWMAPIVAGHTEKNRGRGEDHGHCVVQSVTYQGHRQAVHGSGVRDITREEGEGVGHVESAIQSFLLKNPTVHAVLRDSMQARANWHDLTLYTAGLFTHSLV
jgi:hypothetical protein